jgi:phosphoribosylformimino-5-aminoimidazole carboxamide ribonucleotide (ProFAR) isomerase
VKKSGALAVIVGKAIYERVFTVEEAVKRAASPIV